MAFNTFPSPLEDNKIVLFLTSLEIWTSGYHKVEIEVGAHATSTDTYLMEVGIDFDARIMQLGFSQIIFNSEDVRSTLSYIIVFEEVEFSLSGPTFMELPVEFVDNFIMGFKIFTTQDDSTFNIIHFEWNFETVDGVFGVLVP